ncbi:MAG: hypothetical protein WBJ13_07750, partial [Sedimentibacter sp.]
MNLTMKLADKVLLLDKGRIASYGKTNDVISSKLLSEVYEMDVSDYMLDSLMQWERICEEPYKTK